MLIPLIVAAVLMLIFVSAGCQLNTAFFPTPQDEALRLETLANKTASYTGTVLNLGAHFSPGGLGQQMAAVVAPSVLDLTTGDETYKFTLQESADGNTWTDAGPQVSVTAANIIRSVPGWISQPNVRLNLVTGGTTPIITYDAWLNGNL